MAKRHPSVEEKLQYFRYEHLPEDLQEVSGLCYNLAMELLDVLENDDPQLSLGLQKLIEAKDCFVRSAVAHRSE